MIKRLPMIVLGILVLLNDAMAANQVTVAPGDLSVTTISAKDPTRLSIKGGRIVQLLGGEGKITGLPDKEAGDVYITPTASYRTKPFSLFVKDDQSRIYRLLLTPVDGPAEDLELIPQEDLSKVTELSGQGSRGGNYDIARDWEMQHPYEQGVWSLIQHMDNYAVHAGGSELPPGYGAVVLERHIDLWQETEIELWVRFQGVHYVGEIYRITNKTKEALDFQEKEFYRSGTLAISLDKLHLNPGEVGHLYIVSVNSVKGGADSE